MGREPVTIYDTTLRDDLRNSGIVMTLEQKLRFARQHEQLNVAAVEHFPAASRMLREQPHA